MRVISPRKRHFISSVFVSLSAMMLLASCATSSTLDSVDYRDEAGGVLLSVNSVSRWEQVADAIQPKFNLPNGDAALSKVLPVTARLQEQTLRAFGLSLGVGLQQSFRESVAMQSSQGYTSTTTETTKPGVAPSAPNGTPAGGEFPSGIAPSSDIGINPLLQYRAAASLYQAVQLMNREVELAVKREGYVPYMVRMQLVNIPYRRRLPYDVYAQASFFPSDNTLPFSEVNKKTKLPYVVPLIVTDDLERAIKSSATEVANQISLAVGLMEKGVGGNIGSNLLNRNRNSGLATDFNSLLTVGRMNDNGIYIRLGAATDAAGTNSLVGRTYDITLLVLVPKGYFCTEKQEEKCKEKKPVDTGATGSGEHPIPLIEETKPASNGMTPTATSTPVKLSVIVHTDLRNAESGKLLEERRDVTLADQVSIAFKRILRIGNTEMYRSWVNTPQEKKLEIARKLIGPIQSSDYNAFYNEAYSIMLDPGKEKSLGCWLFCNEEDYLVSNLAEGAKLEDTTSTTSQKKCRTDENDDLLSIKDNGYRLACISGGYLRSLWGYLGSATIESSTKSASVELPVPPDFVIQQPQVALMRDDGKEKIDIVLRDVSGIPLEGISATLVLKNSKNSYEFPSETVLLDPVTGTLALQFPSPAKWNLGEINYASSTLRVNKMEFKVLHLHAPADKPKPGFDLRASTNGIVVNKGVGSVKLVFDNFKDDNVAVLTWSGTEVKSATNNSDGSMVPITLDKITVTSKALLTLEIQNAKPDVKVIFKAVGSKGGKETGEATKEFIVFEGK